MKTLLLAGLLLAAAAPAWAQEAAEPFKGANVIVLHSPEPAPAAYAKAVQALLLAGYSLDKSDKDALFVSTAPKTADGHTYVAVQAVVAPAAEGSDVVLRGTFTWLSAASLMARVENRSLPVTFTGGPNTPAMRAWRTLAAAGQAAVPGAATTYK